MNKRITVCFCLILFFSFMARADEFGSDMNVFIKQLPSSVDLAGMGGLNVCVPTPSGINPAQNATLSDFDFEYVWYQAKYTNSFSAGPDITMDVSAGITELGDGVLRLTYYQLDAPYSKAKGLTTVNDFWAESLEISYGKKLSDQLAVGITFIPFTNSKAEVNLGGFRLGHGESNLEVGMSLGLLYSPIKKVNIGLTYDYTREKVSYSFFGFKSGETSDFSVVRTGISIQPWLGGTVGVEYLFGDIGSTDSTSEKSISYWSAGVEQWLSEHLALRAGLTSNGLTMGCGIKVGEHMFLDYAYLKNSAGTLEKYWGKSNTHLFSCTIVF